jgi:UDP-glucose 4-epimerase
MSWLVTGGAGYIGAHVVRALQQAGEGAVVVDDLSTGVPGRVDVPLVHGSVRDEALLVSTMKEHGVTGVIHLAAKKQVGESVERPVHYYEENVGGLATLLSAVGQAGVDTVLFSSSASVYGMPDVDFVTEDTPCVPLSPYGETKLVGEWLVKAAAASQGFSYGALRYFNVAGCAEPRLADTACLNLVPMVLDKIDSGRAPVVFGGDYPTPDGTCIRDYIHLADVAEAPVAAARALQGGSVDGIAVNLGRGEGVSVREIIDLAREVTGTADDDRFTPEIAARRAGDPARVVASPALANERLGWAARHDVRDIVTSAWEGWQAHH